MIKWHQWINWARLATQRPSTRAVIHRARCFSNNAGTPLQVTGQSTRDSVARHKEARQRRNLGDFHAELRQYLQDGRHQAAVGHFHKIMQSKRYFANPNRCRAYERSTHLFLTYGYFTDARLVYTSMTNEGFLPSPNLRATMLVLNALAVNSTTVSLSDAVREAMKIDGFDEQCLRYILRMVFSTLPCSSYDLESVVQAFLDARPQGYHFSDKTRSFLAYLHTRLGSPDIAKKWQPLEDTMFHHIRDPQERATLAGLSRTMPAIAPILRASTVRLNLKGVKNDQILYNTIIQALATAQQYDQMFMLYRLMLEGATGVTPDAYTFVTLFRIVNLLVKPRTFQTRKHKRPAEMPTLRGLFYDLTYMHGIHTRAHSHHISPVMNPSILNKILNIFMLRQDYAAAFVALRSFRTCNIVVTAETYRIVVGELLRRIQTELHTRRSSEPMWAHRFLGFRTVPLELDARLLDGVLRLGLQPHLNLDPIQLPPSTLLDAVPKVLSHPSDHPLEATEENRDLFVIGEGRWCVPAPLVILGILKPPDDQWTTIPLERILRRAILATFARVFITHARAVSEAIKDAKGEMIYSKMFILEELRGEGEGELEGEDQNGHGNEGGSDGEQLSDLESVKDIS